MVAERRGSSEEEDIVSMLTMLCAEYTDSKLVVLNVLVLIQPTEEQLRAAGIGRINSYTR